MMSMIPKPANGESYSITELVKASFMPIVCLGWAELVNTEIAWVANTIYALFAFAQLAIVGLWCIVWWRASNNSAKKLVVLPPTGLFSSETKKVTVATYDAGECMQRIRQQVGNAMLVSGIHYHWGHFLPLVAAAGYGLMGLADDVLVKLYILGKNEEKDNDLKRPFKEQPLFPQFSAALERITAHKNQQMATGCDTAETIHCPKTKNPKKMKKSKAEKAERQEKIHKTFPQRPVTEWLKTASLMDKVMVGSMVLGTVLIFVGYFELI